MAYVYTKLKEAILGNQGDKISRDMSPNMIKAIFIGRTNIVVAYHTRSCRTIHLDFEKVSQELGNSGVRNESLNNVLNKYKMGCVEEIYADASYRNIPGGYLDLDRYVQGLNRCRLRFYGWYNGDASCVLTCYEKARMEHNYMYCVANDADVRGKILQIEAHNVQGKAEPWYTVHDLRPNDYPVDKSLDSYFNRVDEYLKSIVEENEAKVKARGAQAITEALIKTELGYYRDYQIYDVLSRLALSHCGETGEVVSKHLFEVNIKPGVKRITDIECNEGDTILKESNYAKKLLSTYVGTQMLKSVSFEDLQDRLETGNGLWGTRKAYYERMKNLVRCCNGSKILLISMYNVMSQLGMNVKLSIESMLEYVEEIYQSDDWFSKYNLIVCGLLGFNSYEAVIAFTKALSNRG